ncbi:MAG: hypothetical protein U0175_07855 [Caldilineaceae bacterium]
MINPTSSNPMSIALPQRIRTLLKTVWERRKRPSSSSKRAATIVDTKPMLLTLREAPMPGRNDVVCLEVEGALNRHTYLRLIETARTHHSLGRRSLLLELQQVSEIEISGFFALLSIARLYSGQPLLDPESGWDGLRQAMEEITPELAERVKVVAPSPAVARRLASSTMGQFWELYPDREHALAALPPM